jgi:hypothetical protein
MLPKIENEVLMGARRGLNRWFLALRSGGDSAKAGRAVLRKCANSMAVGPGQLGIGGHVPPSYMWRAKTADNLISRVNQNGRVARAVRHGYWFERDAPKEADRLATATKPGTERRAEAFASAFGWYRCWDENASLMVDITELALEDIGLRSLSSSRHGLGGSRHGKNKTLGFRAKETSSSTRPQGLREYLKPGSNQQHTPWAALLTPAILFEDDPTQ